MNVLQIKSLWSFSLREKKDNHGACKDRKRLRILSLFLYSFRDSEAELLLNIVSCMYMYRTDRGLLLLEIEYTAQRLLAFLNSNHPLLWQNMFFFYFIGVFTLRVKRMNMDYIKTSSCNYFSFDHHLMITTVEMISIIYMYDFWE